jgi:hypothetical protein
MRKRFSRRIRVSGLARLLNLLSQRLRHSRLDDRQIGHKDSMWFEVILLTLVNVTARRGPDCQMYRLWAQVGQRVKAELRNPFKALPSEQLREPLPGHGWRWSCFNSFSMWHFGCNPRSPEQ